MKQPGNKILVCEDDEAIIEIVEVLLTQEGYEVDSSLDGKTALKKITNQKPDLLLIDLWMPGYTGEQIIQQIKKKPELNNIPIILFSASREIESIANKLNVTNYFHKPFDIFELLEAVTHLLPLNYKKTQGIYAK